MLDRHLTSTDRFQIEDFHCRGAARGIFGELHFHYGNECDIGIIYVPYSDVPAFVITKQSIDGIHLMTRAWKLLDEGERLDTIRNALGLAVSTHKRARTPAKSKKAARPTAPKAAVVAEPAPAAVA